MGEGPLVTETIVRLVIAVIIVFVLGFGGCKIYNNVFDTERKYLESFGEFVDFTNEMELGTDNFLLKLKEKSAVIGFDKEGGGYSYVTTSLKSNDESEQAIFMKPSNEGCLGSSCICLCFDGLMKSGSTLTCGRIECKQLKNSDIVSSNLIFSPELPNDQNKKFTYWKNGFFFGRSISKDYNGLPKKKDEIFQLKIEKIVIGNKFVLGVCNSDINDLKNNQRREYFGNRCIVTEFDEAKNLESIDSEKSIQKYEEFIAKYKSGREVEESLFNIGELHLKLNNNEKADEFFNKLIKEHPRSKLKERAEENLIELKQLSEPQEIQGALS